MHGCQLPSETHILWKMNFATFRNSCNFPSHTHTQSIGVYGSVIPFRIAYSGTPNDGMIVPKVTQNCLLRRFTMIYELGHGASSRNT